MKEEQLDFDFFASPMPLTPPAEQSPGDANAEAQRWQLCQSVIAWILKRNPSGLAMTVPTRVSRYQADLAAFWSSPRKKLLTPEATMIVEIRHDRSACWPDCANRDELTALLRASKIEQEAMQARIRVQEPHLQDNDTLFDDFQCWNYSDSQDQEYHHCCKRIEKLEHALYQGSRFEQLRRAHVADYHYLAVPEGTVEESEVAYGWGLLYIAANGRVSMVKEALRRDCPQSGRYHLIQNIAATAMKDVMFAHGVRLIKNDRIVFSQPPKRRRKIKNEYHQDE